ncbi:MULTISPECIES: MFS transporter [Streptomyces]|jgi:MFS transporter, ACS family, tartrate transporter|uniref:MFS transporter n=1 Tax=Streptomyces doudnae TaxID=3075536 RepID=A0ABD5EUA4_9ACTN|nr:MULTISPECIES: MFS transporter [unclassified Streptomyces]MDT0437420.1 MFS transporter [Streptomyces sp. DSM 41981]MYQ67024.1 MFS transporter [Streptomyces sp. SID4950]SCE28838.1 MFS transporter, ACS family, tartrate transporter [Streptomyces sp. SolWspMP-5a-2]
MGTNLTVEGSDPGTRTIRKVTLRIFPIVGLLYVFNYMDRSNISYAELGMRDDLGITTATFGAVASIFFLAYVVLEIPSNMMLKKVGARLWLARIAISWGLVTVVTGFVSSVGHLYVARIALGIAEAGLFPGLLLYLTFWYRGRERGRAIAMLALAQPVAMILGSMTGGWILDHAHWLDLSSWRWVFILQGAPAVLIGIATLLWLPDRPADARFLAPDERAWLQAEIDKEYTGRGPAKETVRDQLQALKNRKVLYLAFANFFAACGLYGFSFFLPKIVQQLDPSYSATNIGLLGAIPFLVGAVGMLLIARNSDRTGERRLHVIGLMLLGALGLAGTIAFRHSPVPALVCLSLVAVGVLGYMAPYWALAARVLPREQTAVGLAGINSIAALGGFVSPYVIGKNATADDVTVGLYFPIGCLVVCAVMLAFLKAPRDERDSGDQPRATAETPV